MPPLKSSAAFHEQRRSLERARTEDYLKRKIRSRPERAELIRMHILEETSPEPLMQAKQLQLKRTRLADDLNDKISHRPGPMELIHKNILPVHSSIKQAIIEREFPEASGDNSSCDEDSNGSLSPGQPVQESPLGLGPLPSPLETLAAGSIPSPSQVVPPASPFRPLSRSSLSLKMTNGMATPSALKICATSQMKPKTNSDRSAQRHKKPKDNKPKIKKLKYHQYIPPDQKGDKERLPHLDSSYSKILQQQQVFLQLQILSQQQQHYNYQTILPAPAKLQKNQQPPASSSSNSMTTSSPTQSLAAASTATSIQDSHSHQSSAPLSGIIPVPLPPNLDELKVVELKFQLKLRSLPVSGTKNDLIERLRTYQEMTGGWDTTSSPAAGAATGPGAEGAGTTSTTAAATTNDNTSHQQQQFEIQQISSQSADAGSRGTPSIATQQLITCGGTVSPSPISPEDTSFSSDPLREMMSSPLNDLSPQTSSATCVPVNIKEEPSCSTPVPCQFSLQKHCQVSSPTPTATTTAPILTADKDKMLQEKDEKIAELTRMLKQKQRLVEVLRMQLELGKKKGRVTEPVVLVRVKQEPPDKPSVPHPSGYLPSPSQTSSVSRDTAATEVTVKQEATETEEVACKTTVQSRDSHGLVQSYCQSQKAHEQIQLNIKPQTKQGQHVCLQQTALQLAQQQAIHKLLLQQQQQTTQNHNHQVLDSQQKLHKPSQQRKKKSHKQQLKQQQQPLHSRQQHQQSNQSQQQMQLKQQFLMQQQKSLLQHQIKQQQPTRQPQKIQLQTKMHLKQQQVLIQQKQHAQQQSPQASSECVNQQPGSLPFDLLKSDSTPALVTDSNGNHFLIALTNHINQSQRPDAPEGKAANHITLQRLQSTPAKLPGHNPVQLLKDNSQSRQSTPMGLQKQQNTKAQNGGLHVPVDQPHLGAPQCLSAPPTLQPFFKDQQTAHSGKNISSPSCPSEVCSSPDVLFSPLSPAFIKMAASSPDNKDTEHGDDFIDIILQTGEMLTSFTPEPDPSLDCLNTSSSASSPPPSPLHLLLSPPVPPRCDTPQPAASVQSELQTVIDTATEEKQHLSNGGSGRLEDFLESTTGKPLLGVELGGHMTLIDDLHSQMLCTPSILDPPPSPMEADDGFDSMDWLDLSMGREREEETTTLAPLGPQTPSSVFSTEFLDSYDLQTQWDSCL
ncbi:myocardin-related transcription factor A-like isoform X2 [Echeneis naucrates]|nr:myocardin-related transcription factor A-like isoform X2 [Echeneis naucrates]